MNFFNPMEDEVKVEVLSEEKIEYGDPITINYTITSNGDYAEFNFAGHDFKADITGTSNSAQAAALGNTVPQRIWKAILDYFNSNGAKNVGGSDYQAYELTLKGVPYKIKSYVNISSRATVHEYYVGTVIPAETKTTVIESTATQLKGIVSQWYYILRNIALLVLMLLLIYSGIRIVIGSTAGEKAKYKERLMDWLVAMCLIFVMHYIMTFSVQLVEKITDLVREAAGKNGNFVIIQLTETQHENLKKIIETEEYDISNIGGLVKDKDENGKEVYQLTWKTDLAGLFRIKSQLTGEGTAKWAGYALCYVVLVLFTLFFAWTYLKRVLYMAFLTMIAPLVAMTYPFDKITDGKAQAFDSWLKEYIFNLMIQPLHILLYAILVSSAYELASSAPLYALVAIGFMMPAEKLMRKFFGFEKAKTPGLLGGAAGAAIAMSGLQSILKPRSHGGNIKGDGAGKQKDNEKVKFSNKSERNAMDDMTGKKPGEGGTTPDISSQVVNKPEYDSRLTEEQKNDMTEEGIGPGDAEYDSWLRQFGIEPNEGGNDTIVDDNEGSSDMLPNDTLVESRAGQGETGDSITTTSSGGSNNRNRRSIKGAVGAALLGVGKQAAAGVLTGVHPLRLAGKIAAGATAGTAGLLLGTASGDPSKAFQYATGGAIAGSALANSLSQNKLLDTDPIKQEMEMAYYGSDYKSKMIERQKKDFQKSSENINYLRQTMGVTHEQARRILETTGEECFNNGITDIKDVATIHQLKNDDNDAMSFEKAAAARTYAKKRLGGADVDQMTANKVREYKNRWAKEFKDRYNISQQEADNLAEQSFNAAIRFNKTYSGLTKM